MEIIEFDVQGSEAKPYKVIFSKKGNNLNAHCSCRAGQVGQYCKHRMRIIMGDTDGIVSDNKKDVYEIQKWFHGTDVEDALITLRIAESKLEEAKKEVSLQKKRLAKALER